MCPVNICNRSHERHYFVNQSITRTQPMNLPSMLFQSVGGTIGPICHWDMITTRRPVFDGFRVAASTYLIFLFQYIPVLGCYSQKTTEHINIYPIHRSLKEKTFFQRRKPLSRRMFSLNKAHAPLFFYGRHIFTFTTHWLVLFLQRSPP